MLVLGLPRVIARADGWTDDRGVVWDDILWSSLIFASCICRSFTIWWTRCCISLQIVDCIWRHPISYECINFCFSQASCECDWSTPLLLSWFAESLRKVVAQSFQQMFAQSGKVVVGAKLPPDLAQEGSTWHDIGEHSPNSLRNLVKGLVHVHILFWAMIMLMHFQPSHAVTWGDTESSYSLGDQGNWKGWDFKMRLHALRMDTKDVWWGTYDHQMSIFVSVQWYSK